MQLIQNEKVKLEMKKHLLGILIFLITFGTGFLFSPIRFSVFAVGSDFHGGFTSFQSTDFVKLSVTRHRFDSAIEVDKSFEEHKKDFEEIFILGKHYDFVYRSILLSENDRVIVFYRTESGFEGYCSYRKGEAKIIEICSASKWHVLEFEKQYFTK